MLGLHRVGISNTGRLDRSRPKKTGSQLLGPGVRVYTKLQIRVEVFFAEVKEEPAQRAGDT
ncbi:MAG: hypothetical protein RIR09_2461 [Pseudomonadota bacterium]|jgi:hypothetical protein